MAKHTTILALAALITAVASTAMAAPPPSDARAARPMRPGSETMPILDNLSRFKCGGGRELTVQFSTGDSDFYAVVDAGDGPHLLPVKAWEGDVPNVTWSDGKRTLVWNVGVQLMFMDGGNHLDCGRGEEHHH
jgi:hypothetical protein